MNCFAFLAPVLLAAVSTCLLVSLAEWLHAQRVRVAARLAFGPLGAKNWTRAVPWLRVASLTAFAWGLTTLLMLTREAPDDPAAKERQDAEATRLVFVAEHGSAGCGAGRHADPA
jgi:hypothetical protein